MVWGKTTSNALLHGGFRIYKYSTSFFGGAPYFLSLRGIDTNTTLRLPLLQNFNPVILTIVGD